MESWLQLRSIALERIENMIARRVSDPDNQKNWMSNVRIPKKYEHS